MRGLSQGAAIRAWNAEQELRAGRRVVGRWRIGLGQSTPNGGPCGDVGEPDCPGPNTPNTTPTSTTNPFGSFTNPAPLPNPTSGLLNPGSPIDVGGSSYGAVGSNGGCSSGYVVGDSSGNCIPASTLAATLATPAGAASMGLTAAQAAAITAGLKTATAIIGGPPTSAVVPISTNPFASIGPTVWIALAAGLGLILVLKKK